MNEDLNQEETENESAGHVRGPAGGHVDFEGIKRAAPLYPLDDESERAHGEPGFQVEDLGLNSDGTNPGTEYDHPDHKKNETGKPLNKNSKPEQPSTDQGL